jgi:hypothetical protein
MIRRDITRSIQFPETIRHGEDFVFFAQLRDHGHFVRVPDELAGYRMTVSQQSKGPDHEFGRLRSVYSWFTNNADRYDQAERNHFFSIFVDKLGNLLDKAYWLRDWHQVGALEEYLAAHRSVPGVEKVLGIRRYPRWCYRVRDWLSPVAGRIAESRPAQQLLMGSDRRI